MQNIARAFELCKEFAESQATSDVNNLLVTDQLKLNYAKYDKYREEQGYE